jgi:hypothetical protein
MEFWVLILVYFFIKALMGVAIKTIGYRVAELVLILSLSFATLQMVFRVGQRHLLGQLSARQEKKGSAVRSASCRIFPSPWLLCSLQALALQAWLSLPPIVM